MIEKNIQIFISYLLFCVFIKEDSYVELLMKSCLYRILSLSCIFALFGSDVSAKYEDNGDYTSSSLYENDYGTESNESFGYNDYESGQSQSYSNQKGAQEEDYYPFTKSTGRIEEREVIGIRVSGNKIVLLGTNKRYYEEQIKGNDFSDFDFFTKYPRLLSVDLSNIKLTRKVLQDLQKYLPRTIKSLIINSCSVEKGDFEELTDIITRHNQLEFITVVAPDWAQAESAKLIAAIGDLKVVRWLNLTLGELETGGCDVLRETLVNSEKTLTSLNLGFKKVEDSESYNALLASLGRLKKLTALEYSVLESTEDQVGKFFNSLAKLRMLVDLKLCFYDFKDHEGVRAYHNAENLNEAMKNLTNLESLDISEMSLPESVLQTISRAMEKLTHLRSLNVSGDPISVKTAKVLAQSLRRLDNLITLIANNCEMSSEAFSALCGGFQNSSIRHLYLSGNKIKTSVKSLSISQMKNLSLLDFSYNGIRLSDIVGFMKTIPSETKLEIINWEKNDFKSLDEEQRINERNKLKIWKKEHRINTLDLGI